ncbi:hypothetical protein [Sulfurimonas sp.]|uniref:hypothetical protein n=1 Tax=Sulfurimonas sp. TaxID=2022749 RepID=UPI0025DC34EC|nr:hypothetical protein [Sulfurimonas sp.]
MIDAEVRSEEKFLRLSLAYKGSDEKRQVISCVENIIKKYEMQPDTHTTSISNGREVIVVEYSDDNNRQVGGIFEEIMKSLNITKCI